MTTNKTSDRWRLFGFIAGFILIGCAFLVIYPEVPHPHPPGYDKLVAAIIAKDDERVAAILKNGFNPNVYPDTLADRHAEDSTPALLVAVKSGNRKIVQLLLDHGADPSKGDGWDYDALDAAIRAENLEMMSLLFKPGTRLNIKDATAPTLYSAATNGKLTSVKFLLAHGATTTPAFVKILKEENKDLEIIRLLEESLKTQSKK